MRKYQKRIIQEKKELDQKIKKLNTFLESESAEKLDDYEFQVMVKQRNSMNDYSMYLQHRIELIPQQSA